MNIDHPSHLDDWMIALAAMITLTYTSALFVESAGPSPAASLARQASESAPRPQSVPATSQVAIVHAPATAVR